MAQSRMPLLIQTLRDKTAEGRPIWQETENETEFISHFASHSVVLRRISGREDEYEYAISILNSDGKAIEELWTEFCDKELSDTLRELWRLARSQALGVDGAYDEILTELESEDPIFPPETGPAVK